MRPSLGIWLLLVALLWGSVPARATPAGNLPACADVAPRRGEPYADFQRRARREQCRKPWTILVYMVADETLRPYALWDLYEMEAGFGDSSRAAGSTAHADLVVQLALPEREQASRIHVFQQPDEPYDGSLGLTDFQKRTEADVRSPVAAQVPRQDASSGLPVAAGADLEAFVRWGIRSYPSHHVMVVVWGHGQGWAPAAGPATGTDGGGDFAGRHFGGLAFSQDERTYLDIPSLHQALKNAADAEWGGRPLDVYASDACLMQMVEVATEISDTARFIVGSSQVQSYLGLPYRRMMAEINAEAMEPEPLARLLPRLMRQSLEAHGLNGRADPRGIQTITMSALASSVLRAELVPALHRLAQSLEAYLGEHRLAALGVEQAIASAPSFMGGSVELGGFLAGLHEELLRAEPQASPLARELEIAVALAQTAMDHTVVAYALGTRYTARADWLHDRGIRALSMWLPVSAEDLQSRLGDFASSDFYRQLDGSWSGWLEQLYSIP